MMQKFLLAAGLLASLSVSAEKAVSSVPPKFADREMTRPVGPELRFAPDLISNREFVRAKKAEWKACRRTRSNVFAGHRDPLRAFLEVPDFVTNLEKMQEKNLTQAEISTRPWSADYWPLANGVLGARYMDPEFMNLFEWKDKYDYVQSNPAPMILLQKGQRGADQLSAAEKYDLLVGNENGEFTQAQWNEGKQYYDESGKVEGWMGICHGWAPAAIMEPRPSKSVELSSLDQKWKIRLNPSEIKGLVSYSWATNQFATAMIGDRCNEKRPVKDRDGRLVQPQCFDLNPASWHISIVNLIGLQDRSFVMDATYDYEVWNQPVTGYSYHYFNPMTRKERKDLEASVVTVADFKTDRFGKYRSPQTQKIVGVVMRVGYVIEASASMDDRDSAEDDIVRWVEYRYDLEIDAKDQIIGGEWYLDAHPDFIWTPRRNVKPNSPIDSVVSEDEDLQDGVVPAEWAKAARAGSPSGLILNKLTEKILDRAKVR